MTGRTTEDPLLALERRMNAVQALIDDGPENAPESVHDDWHSLQNQVAEMPAVSMAGVAVKLRLMRANTEFLDSHEFGDKLIGSTIESAERLACTATVVETPPAEDAAFFDALAEYDRLMAVSQNLERRKEVFRPGIPEAEEANKAYETAYDKAAKAWTRTRDIPTTTQVGLFAKLQAVIRFMADLQEDGLWEAEWVAVKADMRRITGEARP